MIRIAAHQPNFMPYLGFWHKLFASDIFVILDDVDFTYKHKDSYTHRCMTPQGWISVDVEKKEIPINQVKLLYGEEWLKKFENKITGQYGKKSLNFDFLMRTVKDTYRSSDMNLSSFNIKVMIQVAYYLGLEKYPIVVKSSSLDYDRTLTKDYKLKAIFDAVADGRDYVYYSGKGASSFIVNDLFKVEYTTYKPSNEDFSKYSILDLLLRYSYTEVREEILNSLVK